ncbi:hypothetical protein TcasGA2_TC004759 [Tribolium castaneum]|uniref:Microtubule-associated protein Jupiter n=1 Tax=Tribolium castaneum TaxID=7070 RepID=D6W7Y4_TRICA|nr:hypothetical protein TcasGA2_TC004759 [Tribolium castaneum]
MGSSNVFVGLPEAPSAGKNLKGHAHADIFGSTEQTVTPRKMYASKSTIQDILTQETDNKVEKNGNSQPEESKTDENTSEPVQTPVRVRMPPGGHSSGFW